MNLKPTRREGLNNLPCRFHTDLMRGLRWFVGLTLLVGPLFVASTPASATSWSSSLYSRDALALTKWTYDPISGWMNGVLADLAPRDGKCAVFLAKGFTPLRGWKSNYWRAEACDGGQTTIRFTEKDFRQTMVVSVCSGSEQCATTRPAVGCGPGYPIRLFPQAETPDENQYISKIVVCTDLARSATTIQNNTGVVWVIATTNGRAPQVTNVGGSDSNTLFRLIRPDRGTLPLLLPSALVVVAAPPSTVRWTVNYALSASWLSTDVLTAEIVSYGRAQAIDLLTRSSKRWGAVAGCALAVYDAAKFDPQGFDSSALKSILFDAAEVVSGATTCAKGLVEASKDASRRWRVTAGLGDLERALEAPRWGRLVDETLEFAELLEKAVVRLR